VSVTAIKLSMACQNTGLGMSRPLKFGALAGRLGPGAARRGPLLILLAPGQKRPCGSYLARALPPDQQTNPSTALRVCDGLKGETARAQAQPLGISPTNPPVIPVYTPSIPPVFPLYLIRRGLQGV
jgi:hypothetical protein